MGRNIDSIPAETLRTLTRMEWPGNVRELGKRYRTGGIAHPRQRTAALPAGAGYRETPRTPAAVLPEEGEDEYQLIVRVLKESNGVVAGAERRRPAAGAQAHHAPVTHEAAGY